ncbi:hypothetical protein [Castellaniella sp.]|uniref:hypothetical protein n=1 Tax=Castellaniella sp. TaxID=1955812 RepID=UPI003569C76B
MDRQLATKLANDDMHFGEMGIANPNIDSAEHVLNIDNADNQPSSKTILSTAVLMYWMMPELGKLLMR